MNEVSKLIDRTITEVEFDNTITSIGFCAFDSCSSLTSVTIPSWITSINSYAFSNCSSLTSVTCLATTPPTLGSGAFNGSSCPIYVPTGTLSTYRSASGWNSYANKIFEYGVADWRVIEQSCELDGSNKKTGYFITVEKDYNPSSSTYNTTRSTRVEDLVQCNPSGNIFTKITQLADATSGKYLIVDTSVNKALNASLIKSTTSTGGLNAANNFIDVTIENDTITADATIMNAAADYDADNHTLSWTDSNTGTTYYLYWTGASNAKFAYSGNTSPSMSYPMEAKQINSNFTIGNSTRSLGYNTSGPRIQFYSTNNTNMFANIALFKLN